MLELETGATGVVVSSANALVCLLGGVREGDLEDM